MVNQQKPTKPQVTPEEKTFRKNLFPDIKDVKNKNVLCTSCGRSVKELIGKGKPISHPFMETLLCEKCKAFYGDGQFSEDEDGCDKYCRWCGQGGTLFLCSGCTAGFCKKCVKRNLPRAALQEIENDDWVCYCCNATPLFELRAQCWAAQQYAQELKAKPSCSSSSRSKSSKSKRTRDDSDSDYEDNVKPKKKKTDDLKKVDNEKKVENEKKVDNEDRSSRRSREKSKKEEPKKRSEKSKSENGDDEGDDVKTRRTSLRERKPQKVKDEDEISDGVPKTKWNTVIKKCDDLTGDLAKFTKEVHKKVIEFKVKKVNFKHINTFQSLSEVRKHVNDILVGLSETSTKVQETFNEYCEEWIKEAKVGQSPEKTAEPTEGEEAKNEAVENGITEESKMDVDDSSVPEPNKDNLVDEESQDKPSGTPETTEPVEEKTRLEEDESNKDKADEDSVAVVDSSDVTDSPAITDPAASSSASPVKENGGGEAKEASGTSPEPDVPVGEDKEAENSSSPTEKPDITSEESPTESTSSPVKKSSHPPPDQKQPSQS